MASLVSQEQFPTTLDHGQRNEEAGCFRLVRFHGLTPRNQLAHKIKPTLLILPAPVLNHLLKFLSDSELGFVLRLTSKLPKNLPYPASRKKILLHTRVKDQNAKTTSKNSLVRTIDLPVVLQTYTDDRIQFLISLL